SIIGLNYIKIAIATPRIIDIDNPNNVIIKVAGRWFKNNSLFNSHNLTPIPIGDGKINIMLTILAATSQITSNRMVNIIADKYFLICHPSTLNDQLIVFLMKGSMHGLGHIHL